MDSPDYIHSDYMRPDYISDSDHIHNHLAVEYIPVAGHIPETEYTVVAGHIPATEYTVVAGRILAANNPD